MLAAGAALLVKQRRQQEEEQQREEEAQGQWVGGATGDHPPSAVPAILELGLGAWAAGAVLGATSALWPAPDQQARHTLACAVSYLETSQEEVERMAEALLPLLKAAAQQRAAPGSPPAQQAALERCLALGARRCAHLGCTNAAVLLGVTGGGSGSNGGSGSGAAGSVGRASGGGGGSRRCSGCMAVRFCCAACSKAEWRQHKAACRQLAAQREAACMPAQ